METLMACVRPLRADGPRPTLPSRAYPLPVCIWRSRPWGFLWVIALLAATPTGCSDAESGRFPARWIDGTHESEPRYQVHEYSLGTWIIRQSLTTHFEGPFLYLLQGNEEALLLDTGAPTEPWLRDVVDGLIGDTHPLVIAHSHAHSDHVAGDLEFKDRPNVRIVGHSRAEVAEFAGLTEWSEDTGTLDLGGRQLLIIPIPGHEASSIAIYDELTGLLLTGDSLYPGRLYVQDFTEYRRSVDRLVQFLSDQEVNWVLGAHIEMTAFPGQDFGPLQPAHPNERELQLEWSHVLELQAVFQAMGSEAEYTVRDDFIVYPLD